MRDRPIIYTGLAIFLALVTYPVWHNVAVGANSRGPEPKLPPPGRQCVAPAAYMKKAHMDLLLEWRESVVRSGAREFTAADGRRFDKSLTGTCLGSCHGAKADFCDKCHNYAAVKVVCWDCHTDAPRAGGVAVALASPEVAR